jgi:hypothetical protein
MGQYLLSMLLFGHPDQVHDKFATSFAGLTI